MLKNILFLGTSTFHIMVNHLLFSAALHDNFMHTVCALVFCGGWCKIDLGKTRCSQLKCFKALQAGHYHSLLHRMVEEWVAPLGSTYLMFEKSVNCLITVEVDNIFVPHPLFALHSLLRFSSRFSPRPASTLMLTLSRCRRSCYVALDGSRNRSRRWC